MRVDLFFILQLFDFLCRFLRLVSLFGSFLLWFPFDVNIYYSLTLLMADSICVSKWDRLRTANETLFAPNLHSNQIKGAKFKDCCRMKWWNRAQCVLCEAWEILYHWHYTVSAFETCWYCGFDIIFRRNIIIAQLLV